MSLFGLDNNYENADGDIAVIREKLKALAENERLLEFLGDDFKKSLKEWNALIDKRCSEPFSLVVLGDFKRGKSTIINAILGKELAPVDAAPETYTINEITYGEETSVEAVLDNGERVPIDIKDVTRERLEAIMPTLSGNISYLDIRDNSPILQEIRIVDTPGLSDLDDLDHQVTDYLINADAIIYVASALLPFSESEQMFLSSHIRPQRFGTLYVLVNMVDALSSQADVDKIMARIYDKSEEIIPNSFVYGISGADEFRRRTGADRGPDKGFREYYETEFFKFEISLQRDIIMQKDIIRTRRVLNLLERALTELSARVHMFADMAAMDKQNLAELSVKFDEQCRELSTALESKKPLLHINVMEMQQEAESWMYGFFSKLRESILLCREPNPGAAEITAEEVEKYFYTYLMDKVGEAYRKCIEIHRGRLGELLDNWSQQLSDKLGLSDLSVVSKATTVDRLMVDIQNKVSRSVMDIAQYGASEHFPRTTMDAFKNILKRKKQSGIIDITLENFDDIRANTVKDMKNAYGDLENKARASLDDIYRSQEAVGREALSRAKEMADRVDNDTLSDLICGSRDAIDETAAILSKYVLSGEDDESGDIL